MKVDSLLDILKNKHNYKITKKEIINIIDNINEDLEIADDVIFFGAFKSEKEIILSIKEQNPDYYIIEDIDEFLAELDINYDAIFNACIEFEIFDEGPDTIQTILSMGPINMDLLKDVLNDLNIKLSPKKLKDFYKKLKTIQQNIRVWTFNGYRMCDCLNKIESSKKVGRNELCTCGSGKKYKKCCGK